MRGTIKPVLEEFGVTFRVMHGFGGATAVHDIAEATADLDRPLIALYVGDWDPSGLFMSEVDLPNRLQRYGGNVHLDRIALQAADIATLSTFDAGTKTGDKRHAWFVRNYGTTCAELDSMPPPILRARVRAAILRHLDQEAWDHCARVERAELESLRSFKWGGVFRDQSGNTD